MKIAITTQEKMFRTYEKVRESGMVNMFDTKNVILIAKEMYKVVLVKEDIVDIMNNYESYAKQYN